uniref:ABC transporter permease n=1 Tax=Demequina sp. TaxID=2050685 RepID=UPI0025BACD3D
MSAQRVRRVGPHLVWWGLAALPLGYLSLFFVWPLATVLWRGLTQDGSVRFDLAAQALTDPHILRAVGTTLVLAGAGTIGSLLLGVPAAYALFRLRWPGVSFVRAAASVPFVLPTVVVAAAFSALVGRGGPLGWTGLDQSPWVIVAALVFYNTSVVMRVVGGAWAGLDPGRVAAARTLGASRLAAFRHITLPALGPALASAASLAFLFCASSFGIVLVLGGTRVSTIETEIYLQVNQFLDLRTAALLSLIQLVIVGLTLWVTDRARRARERSAAVRRI